jgi:hypothetical protein
MSAGVGRILVSTRILVDIVYSNFSDGAKERNVCDLQSIVSRAVPSTLRDWPGRHSTRPLQRQEARET